MCGPNRQNAATHFFLHLMMMSWGEGRCRRNVRGRRCVARGGALEVLAERVEV
jgi:hypothetical protein